MATWLGSPISASSVQRIIRNVHDRRFDCLSSPTGKTHPSRGGTETSHHCGRIRSLRYSSIVDPDLHLALTVGGVGVERGDEGVPVQSEPVLVRVHSECLTGDVLHSALCDCGSQLHFAMQQIVESVEVSC